MSSMNFTCDVCGREVFSCTFVNGMKFCAKCYQETFGETDEDRKIADLEAKLAESEKKAYSRGHSQRDIANEIKLNALREDVANKEKLIVELKQKAIVPKFKVGQEIWETTPLMSWKIKRIECHKFDGGNGDVVMEIYRLGHDMTDDYNCCIMPVDNDRFFATKKEALEKLKELGEKK